MSRLGWEILTYQMLTQYDIQHFQPYFRKAAKKQSFFSGPATKAFPPPLSLVATKFVLEFLLELQKTVFFLSGKP